MRNFFKDIRSNFKSSIYQRCIDWFFNWVCSTIPAIFGSICLYIAGVGVMNTTLIFLSVILFTTSIVLIIKKVTLQHKQGINEVISNLTDDIQNKKKPACPYPYNGKGVILYQLGQYEEAIKLFDKAIEINPNYPEPYTHKGLCLTYLKMYEEALECHNKSIKLNPNHSGAYNNKGKTFVDMGKLKEAMECFNEAIKLQQINS